VESLRPENALPPLRRAIELDATYSPAHYYLGLAYESLGQPAEASAALEQALSFASDEDMRARIRRHLNELQR
jgi:Flp pilus assembly protein TadD